VFSLSSVVETPSAQGVCNKDVAINILLTILGYVPGIIHALWVFATYESVRPHTM
jgi:hypothetical protein